MPRIQFLGHLSPIAQQITVLSPHSFSATIMDNLTLVAQTEIIQGRVIVHCEVSRFETSDVPYLLPHIRHIAQALVNLIAFSRGDGITVLFDSVIDPNGQNLAIISRDPRLAALCTAFHLDRAGDADSFLQIIMADGTLAVALNDLIQANNNSFLIPVNCGRVIDGLRSRFDQTNAPRLQSWRLMRERLRVSEPYLRYITDHSVDQRHGQGFTIDGNTTSELLYRTWAIMNRFLIYRSTGNTPLPDFLFPELAG